jgi:hypothetical protein
MLPQTIEKMFQIDFIFQGHVILVHNFLRTFVKSTVFCTEIRTTTFLSKTT